MYYVFMLININESMTKSHICFFNWNIECACILINILGYPPSKISGHAFKPSSLPEP